LEVGASVTETPLLIPADSLGDVRAGFMVEFLGGIFGQRDEDGFPPSRGRACKSGARYHRRVTIVPSAVSRGVVDLRDLSLPAILFYAISKPDGGIEARIDRNPYLAIRISRDPKAHIFVDR